MKRPKPTVSELADEIRAGDRAALARAITLVESGRPADRGPASALLAAVWPQSGGALRIGLTGAPGVGKSTFIDAFGNHLLDCGRRLAVLAVDPASDRGGGAILGDRTRMARLTARDATYIRASSDAGATGGVAPRTREAICLCEAAGYDVVIVETVGVGQSDSAVSWMTDAFALLVAPGGGDELQGVKRGVMELADLTLVTKCDGDFATAAKRTCAEYASALRLLRRRPDDPPGFPAAMTVSALAGLGIAESWDRILQLDDWRRARGRQAARRRGQLRRWARDLVVEEALRRVRAEAGLPACVAARLDSGKIDPHAAASEVTALDSDPLRGGAGGDG